MNPIAKINVKNFGQIVIELEPKHAPNTVANFINLAQTNFYNGLTFHRIVKDFVIQAGDPDGNGQGGPGYTIEGEFTSNGFENNLKHDAGTISMARTSNPNSAGSQFFITHTNTNQLDANYAAFGKVTSGFSIVDAIANVETILEKPVKNVIIENIEIETFGNEYKVQKYKGE